MSEEEMKRLVEMVRNRAEVPRVRSSEVRRIIEVLQAIANEGMVDRAVAESA
ncbi:hypothetical protein [Tabrizicola fusiformis]|uniref:hypothetical protein n=1 Tax=Tabrizicola sp. SY72 TaxID=2741673 RepID=UPI0015730E5F|nr:hypothetical protein [Tabrizicola sp. SY72]NTT88244.1 hypothetical protein [Tabrizicola sp. SY72]